MSWEHILIAVTSSVLGTGVGGGAAVTIYQLWIKGRQSDRDFIADEYRRQIADLGKHLADLQAERDKVRENYYAILVENIELKGRVKDDGPRPPPDSHC